MPIFDEENLVHKTESAHTDWWVSNTLSEIFLLAYLRGQFLVQFIFLAVYVLIVIFKQMIMQLHTESQDAVQGNWILKINLEDALLLIQVLFLYLEKQSCCKTY